MYYIPFYILFMLFLLGCSAFFSGTETALFSLSRTVTKSMQNSKHKTERMVYELLQKPERLLGSLLLGNLIINILFFSTASVLSVKLEENVSTTVAAIAALVSFTMLIMCGEILPKYLSYNNSKKICTASVIPVFLIVRFFSPIVSLFRNLFVKPIFTLFLGPLKQPESISATEFQKIIESATQQGLISLHEDKILTELVDFGFLKAKHVLQPRVDVITCKSNTSIQDITEIMVKNHLTKLPIYAKTIDDIIGIVELRDILLNPEVPLKKIIKGVDFIPEQKSVESIIEFFRKKHIDTAIVVDEYGGMSGLVCMEDIARDLFGSIGIDEEVEMIKQLSAYEYRLAGYLPVHDWMKRFGIKPHNVPIATISGFVAYLLGNIPKKGDVASWKNLTFTVEQVKKHRIVTVLLSLKTVSPTDV